MNSRNSLPLSSAAILSLFALLFLTAAEPQCGNSGSSVVAPTTTAGLRSGDGNGGSCPDFNPPDTHTHLEKEDSCMALHMPGYENPMANGCTDCHGADLMGGSAPSCFTCHGAKWEDGDHDGHDHHGRDDDDEDDDDCDGGHHGRDDDDDDDDHDGHGGSCPDFTPPESHTVMQHDDGCVAFHMPGYEDPLTNGCTDCHGPDLMGDFGPSCFTCHGPEWQDEEHQAARQTLRLHEMAASAFRIRN